MTTASVPLADAADANSAGWLRRELAPTPGRAMRTVRIVITVALVTVISMALQVPEASLSAYLVLFVTKENRKLTTLAGMVLGIGVTLALAVSLLLYRVTFDFPLLRVFGMATVIFCGMYLSRVFVIGPLGFAFGFVVAITQGIVDEAPTPELTVRALLWLWVIVLYPIAMTVVVDRLLPSVSSTPQALPPRSTPRRFFVADAFSNPAYAHFALKVSLAAMTCYFIYTSIDWPGIRTAFITCCFVALETTEASLRKAQLRLIGCLIGGTLGFLSILFLVPHMETIVSLVLLVSVVTAFAGWIAAGSNRIAYAGLQIAFAFYLSVFQGFAPATDFDVIRNRVVGVLLGIAVFSVIFQYLWPERERPEHSA